MSTVFVGLMSGTSIDGADGVIVDVPGGAATAPTALRVLAHAHADFPAPLRRELLALNLSSADEIHRGALAANALARTYAGVVETLLAKAAIDRRQVAAIGCHGQTVRHRPKEFDGTGYTVQLNAPALLAELTGIDVVADFRSRDVAAGGHGAPLAPAFHRAMFWNPGRTVAVLNLGGIANLTAIGADGSTLGFDCGPANTLLDRWSVASTGQAFDAAGSWAASGQLDQRLLDALLSEPYFGLSAPKSTGRDLFDEAWLEGRLTTSDARRRLRPHDIQATLSELSARTSADAFRGYAPDAPELIVCGGGARNLDLMARIGRLVAPAQVVTSTERGLPVDQVEAVAFAWLARAFTKREPGNIASVTGAAGARVLGGLYPAG
jgi:anhydro-N-acetylmuramic acid kinase